MLIKTKYLYLGPYNNSIKTLHESVPDIFYNKTIEFNYISLVEENEVKYLGVVFDNMLTFKKQIHITTMKINKMVGILWICRDLPTTAKLIICHSLGDSHLHYCILIWGSHLEKNAIGDCPLDQIPNQLTGKYSPQ